MFRRDRRGFTLIELLVVIAIIGILASIVLASLNTARKKSRDARRISDIKQLQLALELYFDANSASYPAGTDLTPLQTQGFIPVLPKDPSNSALNYNYQGVTSAGVACTAAPCTSYHIGTTLAEHSNPALANDKDSAVGFYGFGKAAEGTGCPAASDGGTTADETCYDVIP